ncbi:hypothetical protein [Actinokineospora sp. HUAS TT18]|uniref:hypothetical protein n=1 Tax=Actinokineospora sp. HUAS TT18 TaxID=3447451 RepID=UPI003F51EB9F
MSTVEYEADGWAGTHHLLLALRLHRVGGLADGVKPKDVCKEIGRQFEQLYRELGAAAVTVDVADDR